MVQGSWTTSARNVLAENDQAGLVYNKQLNWGTFNPITWIATFALACLINTAIECVYYLKALKVIIRRREIGWILIANAASVSVALGSIFVAPIQS